VRLELSYRAILLLILVALGIFAFARLWPIVVIVITSFIFMAALLPYVEWLTAHKVPRIASVLIVMLTILGILAGVAGLVGTASVNEFNNVRDNLPQDAKDTEDLLDKFGIHVQLQDRARNIDWNRVISGDAAINYGQRAVTIVLGIITVFVLTAYLLADTPRMNRFLYQFVPPGREPELGHWLQSLRNVVGGYIRGQVITSIVISAFTFVVLVAVRVPNAAAFALLAGFVDIIPIVGAVIAVVMPTLAAFQESTTQAIIVLALLLLYQQFEDRILTPRVYGQTLNLPPVIVLVAVLIGGQLFGIPGVLLALPAAAVARVVLDYYLEQRRNISFATPIASTDEIAAPDTERDEG
jgi:predicted PurR-regulated permease PerM